MGLESPTYISDLVATNPTTGDGLAQGDDHLRNLKTVLKNTFTGGASGLSGAVTATHTELNYVGGVTSAIQTQLNTKAAAQGNWVQIKSTGISGTPTSVDLINATASVVIDSTYDKYLVTFSAVKPSTDEAALWMRTTTNATDFDEGASDYQSVIIPVFGGAVSAT